MGARQLSQRGWRGRLCHEVEQSPLISTACSLAGLAGCWRAEPPQRVMVGIGLCSGEEVSDGLPFDALGLLLTAERVRRAIGARLVSVVVADEHARDAGVDPWAVAAQARRVFAILEQLEACALLPRLEVLRAGRLPRDASYRALLRRVGELLGPDDGDYLHRQLADMAWLARRPGGALKVGWSVGDNAERHRRDEVAFDRRYRQHFGCDLPFVYIKAGRTLDPARPKASPYIVQDRARRVLLDPDEDLEGKLRAAPEAQARRGVERHLKRVLRVYGQTWERLRGPLPAQLRALYTRLRLGGPIDADATRSLSLGA